VAGRDVSDLDVLQDALDTVKSGGMLQLKILRGAEERTVDVKL
jgi:hypothetical protein